MPADVVGHFGPELRRFMLVQVHHGQITAGAVGRPAAGGRHQISKRQSLRLLNEGQDFFLGEARDVLRAGLATAALAHGR
jgi:hypothetical protein